MIALPQGVKGLKRARECLGSGEFARLFNTCVEYMVSYGYAPSTLEKRVSGITHFLYWIRRTGGRVSRIRADHVDDFMTVHLAHCDCSKVCAYDRNSVRRSLLILLQVLRRSGQKVDLPIAPDSVKAELIAFDKYLIDVGGNTPATRRSYVGETRRFLSRLFNKRHFDAAQITPDRVRGFIKLMSSRRSHLHHVVVALRSYLRFKAVGGMQVTDLLAAVPKTAQWRLARLPKTLTVDETKNFLESFDRSTTQGRRDYAIARCLIDLGLRAGETARLQLEDIDWRAGTISIRGKGQRVQMLPLTNEAGAALVEYITKARPKTQSRAVFMALHAPLVPATATTIEAAMSAAARRCGLEEKVKGSHVLRHSIAARLLESGATLKGIADVLRHDSFDTTKIYTKVDLPALKRVAMPWIGRTA